MASSADVVRLAPDSDVLTPLPHNLHRGLTAVAVLASISFAASTLTVLYLTFKLVRWHLKTRRRGPDGSPSPGVDLSLGLAQRHFGGSDGEVVQVRKGENKRRAPNQFLVLLYNLLIADMHQALAFLINGVWVASDAIQVGSPVCFLQGWLVSTGDMSGGLFLSAIAIHTYMAVVWDRKPPQWAVYAGVIGIWVFTYFMAALGIAITHNGKSGGGFYVRAGAWCWINIEYENIRLLVHYLFIFISLAVVSILYTLIFFSLRRRQKQADREFTPSHSNDQSQPKTSVDFRSKVTRTNSASIAPKAQTGHHPAFLIYPVIYVFCTAPLALGRIATMAGAKMSLGYFCAAGALITSNGWLDVLLWGLTRRVLLFESDIDAEDLGLATFGFMRTPPERKYGNMVWVQGASGRAAEEEAQLRETGADEAKDGFGWWRAAHWWRARSGRGPGAAGRRRTSSGGQILGHRRTGSRSISQESLRGGRGDMAIQMDVVTTVEVEVDADKRDTRTRQYSLSVNSSEKDVRHHRT